MEFPFNGVFAESAGRRDYFKRLEKKKATSLAKSAF